jgi:hypothetical protein
VSARGTLRRWVGVTLVASWVPFAACRDTGGSGFFDGGTDSGSTPGTDYRGDGGFSLTGDGGLLLMAITLAVVAGETVSLPEAQCTMPLSGGQFGPIEGCYVAVGQSPGCQFQFWSGAGTAALDGGALALNASGQLTGCGIDTNFPAGLTFEGYDK